MSETTIRCYRCNYPLMMQGEMGWCILDEFWVDKPREPRAEMPAETESLSDAL